MMEGRRRRLAPLVLSFALVLCGLTLTSLSLTREDRSLAREGDASLDVGQSVSVSPPDVPESVLVDAIFFSLSVDKNSTLSLRSPSLNKTVAMVEGESLSVPLDELGPVSIVVLEADGPVRVAYSYLVLGHEAPFLLLSIPGAILSITGLALLAISFSAFLMERAGLVR